MCEKNADIQEEIIIDEESSTGGSVADSDDRYFDFELQSMQKSDQTKTETVTNVNETNNKTNGIEQQKPILNVKVNEHKLQMLLTENDLPPKKKIIAPKPPNFNQSKSPVKQEVLINK